MYNNISALISLKENMSSENESNISLFSIKSKDGINDTSKYMITIQTALPLPASKKIFRTLFRELPFLIPLSPPHTILTVHDKNYNRIPSFP